ncbi:MAG: hypothetical protein JNK48_01930 [Bryobacterales bacterium]|nr:hypothetical protein [Bryobacterales bacterium]
MPQLTKWNHYASFKTSTELVIQAVDLRLTPDLVDQTLDLTVYAGRLRLGPPIHLPGRNIRIFAAELINDPGACLDSSGDDAKPEHSYAPGKPAGLAPNGLDGAAGAAGGKGQPAGSVTLRAASISGPLLIRANGGRGGRGQDGGIGAQGAPGPNGAPLPSSNSGFAGDSCSPENGTPGGKGGKGGTAGSAGPGGRGGSAGVLQFLVPSTEVSLIQVAIQPGPGGHPGAHGSPGPGGPGGRGGAKIGCRASGSVNDGGPYYHWFVKSWNPPGPLGDNGDTVAAQPQPGDDGPPATPPSLPLWNEDAFSAHASYCLVKMLLHKAELDYMNSRRDEALDWLAKCELLTRPGAGSQTPSYGLPGSPFQNPLVPSHGYPWEALRVRVVRLLSQLNLGLTYSGTAENYVPLLDFVEYKETTQSIFEHARAIEESYRRYAKAENDKQSASEAARDSIAHKQQYLSKLARRRDQLEQNISQLRTEINQANFAVARLQQEVLAADTVFQNAVLHQAKHCGVDSLVDFVTMVASVYAFGGVVTPHLAAIGALLNEEEEKPQPPSKSKKPKVKKALVKQFGDDPLWIRKIRDVSGPASGIWKAWKEMVKELPQPGDVSAKIAVTQEDYEKALKPYLTLPEAQAYRNLLHVFLDTIQTRNTKQTQYNALLAQRDGLLAEVGTLRADIGHLDGLLAANADPNLTEIRIFMEDAYLAARRTLCELLGSQVAALRYFALEQIPAQFEDEDIATLSSTQVDLLSRYTEALENRNRQDQRIEFPYDLDAQEHNSAFRLFWENGILIFTLPLDALPPLYTSVLVSEVAWEMPGLEAAATPSKPIRAYARLVHMGNPVIMDRFNIKHEFIHTPRASILSWSSDGGGVKTPVENNLGGLAGKFAFLSPFAGWRLEFDRTSSTNLDLSVIKSIRLNFKGFALAPAVRIARPYSFGTGILCTSPCPV